MSRHRSAFGLAVLAIAVSGCSPAMREWWTEDLRDPRARMPRDTATQIYARPREAIVAEDIDAPPPAPLTSPVASALPARPDVVRPTSPQMAALPPPRRAGPGAVAVPPPQRLEKPTTDEPVNRPQAASPGAAEEPILPTDGVSLAGLSEASVRDVMGHPDAVARKGAQTIWTYDGSGCSVEVIFFTDVMRRTNAALDTKTIGPDRQTPSAAPCMRIATASAQRR